jgi:hypothetical protein
MAYRSTRVRLRSRIELLNTSSRSSIARSDRELRSTLAKIFRELDRSPIAARSVRPRKLGHIRSRECYEQLRSILIDLRTFVTHRKKIPAFASTNTDTRAKFFRKIFKIFQKFRPLYRNFPKISTTIAKFSKNFDHNDEIFRKFRPFDPSPD